MARMIINFHITKFWREGSFWIAVIMGLIALAVYSNPFPSDEINKISVLSATKTYPVATEPVVREVAVNWLDDKSKCLSLLYPRATECGLGVIQHDSKTYATFIIRKSEVSQWDRRYMESIVYYFKYYPVGTDSVDIDWDTCKINQSMEDQLLSNINKLRRANNYDVISANKELTTMAREHSASMALQGKEFIYGINTPYYMVLWPK